MLDIEQALAHILECAAQLPAQTAELANCLDRVLAESVASDVDSPPHDKSLVDGYAVNAASLTAPGAMLHVVEEVTAGAVPTQAVEPGTATRIMTGAPLPPGADAVVMVEQTDLAAGAVVMRQESPVRPGQNIMRRAASLSRGQTVLAAGTLLRPIEVGLLAEVGKQRVSVFAQPRVAVLATGNELVEVGAVPGPGQIRNSNGPMMAALAQHAGAAVHSLGIARDTQADLHRLLADGLSHDVLVISGGVSAGVLDLVPHVLGQLEVQQVFHKVNLKPGKPLWFGQKKTGAGRPTLVFGLPGNPVSSLVCFELFVRPAIQKLRGLAPRGLLQLPGRLTREHHQRGDRPTYWPARWADASDGVGITPLTWQGSGDLRTLSEANCLALFPAGEQLFRAGDLVTVRLLAGEM